MNRIEPGGVVTVRFAADGSERRLMVGVRTARADRWLSYRVKRRGAGPLRPFQSAR